MSTSYPSFPKIPRWNREVIVTEKIDGTNSQIFIEEITSTDQDVDWDVVQVLDGPITGDRYVGFGSPGAQVGYALKAGSRNRWLTPGNDNFGFASWVYDNAVELTRKLGPGAHFGEWYGSGIQRGYGLPKGQKRFMLFNTSRWADPEVRPACTEVATVLFQGTMGELMAPTVGPEGFEGENHLDFLLDNLRIWGSRHVRGFLNPEGVVLYHAAANQLFKVLLENDDTPKGNA